MVSKELKRHVTSRIPSRQICFYGVFGILAATFFAAVFLIPSFSSRFVSQIAEMEAENGDAISIAVQLGRLDLVSLAVAFLGLGVGFFAIFSFFQIREDAKASALKTLSDYVHENLENIKDDIKKNILIELKSVKGSSAAWAEGVDISDKRSEGKQDV